MLSWAQIHECNRFGNAHATHVLSYIEYGTSSKLLGQNYPVCFWLCVVQVAFARPLWNICSHTAASSTREAGVNDGEAGSFLPQFSEPYLWRLALCHWIAGRACCAPLKQIACEAKCWSQSDCFWIRALRINDSFIIQLNILGLVLTAFSSWDWSRSSSHAS